MRYGASSLSTTQVVTGSVSDTRAQDELICSIAEDVTTGLTATLTVSASSVNLVPDFLRVYGWYSGAATHWITVSVYNFNTSAYVDVGRMQGGSTSKEYLFGLGSVNYHSLSTGEMRVRFLHAVTTYNPSHTLNINAFCVEKGVTVAAIWDEVISPSLHNVKNSAAYKIWRNTESLIYTGMAVGGTANTIQLAEGTSAEDDGAYDPAMIAIIGGTGVGQSRLILGYKGHPDHIAVVDRDWKIIPAADSEVIISAHAGREHVNEGLARGGTVNTITLNTNASPFDDAYNAQVVFLRSGQGQDQARRILDYDGATKVAIVSRDWAPGQSPNTTSAYVVLPSGAISDNCIGRAVWSDIFRDYVGVLGSAAEALDALVPSGGAGVSQEQLDALLLAFGELAADSYAGGSVSNPTPVLGNRDIVLFADTDHDNIEFNVGPQWSTYLNEANTVPWFTVKADPRQTTSLIDAQAVITDPNAGLITLSLNATQTDVKEGTFFWQLKLVRTIVTGVSPDEVTTYKKRMLMEGKVYIKPTFKV